MSETVTTSDAEHRGARPGARGVARITAAAAGVFFGVSGLWAMVAPRSFFEVAAEFEPYNRHFIQDIGAFQIGLGAVLLLAAFTRADALAVTLVGVGIGSAAHLVSHVVGHDLGGSPALDIPFFTVLTVVLLVAGALRWRSGGGALGGT
jgi:hypothetical protein